MSLRFINHLLYRMPVRLTPGEFRLLVYFADLANTDGENIFPAVERLAEWTGLSDAYIRHAVRQFKARGWVSEYTSKGLARWRLRLPGLTCGKAVETLWKTPLFDDPTIEFHDPTIVIDDRRIVGPSPEQTAAPSLTDEKRADPSFYPSFYPSKEEVPGGGAALPALSSDVTPEEGRVRFAMLKAKLDTQRAALKARPRPRRRR